MFTTAPHISPVYDFPSYIFNPLKRNVPTVLAPQAEHFNHNVFMCSIWLLQKKLIVTNYDIHFFIF